MSTAFIDSWRSSIQSSNKLSFYCSVKTDFVWEKYLDVAKTFDNRRAAARIRCSSHKLNCELGRHKNIPKENRTCDHCVAVCVPNPPIEDEDHVLHSCPLSETLRSKFRHTFTKATLKDPNPNIARIYLKRDADTHNECPVNASTSSKEEICAIRISTRVIEDIYKLTLKRKKEIKSRT